MRCGICGKDTMRDPRTGDQRPIYDADALNRHKILEHPIEYRAAREARQAKAWTTKLLKAVEARRVSDARLAASRPVVALHPNEKELKTYPSSKVARHQVRSWDGGQLTAVRFPEPEVYRLYLSIMGDIAQLEAEAQVRLTTAWEMGTPVTLEHLDELDRAAEVSPQAR